MKGRKSGWNLGSMNRLFMKLLFTSSSSSAWIQSLIFVNGLCGSSTFGSTSWMFCYQDWSLPPLPLFWSHLHPCKLSVSVKLMAMSLHHLSGGWVKRCWFCGSEPDVCYSIWVWIGQTFIFTVMGKDEALWAFPEPRQACPHGTPSWVLEDHPGKV